MSSAFSATRSLAAIYEDRLFEEIRPKLALGLVRIPMRRSISPSDVKAFYQTYRHFKQLQPNIIHAHGAKGGAYGRIIGSWLRVSGSSVARFYCPHGGSIHYDKNSLKGRMFFTLERTMERMTDRLIFVSGYEKNGYIEKIGKPRCPTTLVYNGLSPQEFTDVEPQASPADFLYIGMMRDLKGPDVFLAAMEKLLASGKKVTAHFVGEGPDKDAYIARINRSSLKDAVTVHDAMPARVAFAMARCVVVPSRAESLPYIVLEAIGAGRPIICTHVGGIPEILNDETGKLVAPGDADALASAMAGMLVNRDATAEAAARKIKLQGRFSVQKMADDIMSAYRASV